MYRGSISVSALVALATLSTMQWMPEKRWEDWRFFMDVAWFVSNASLFLSTSYIHIYVKPLKQFLQLLCLLGALGALGVHSYLPEEAIAVAFAKHPWITFLVGPSFACLTGIAFKEGVCYGKPEAFALCALTPSACLLHLASTPLPIQKLAWLAWMIAYMAFATKKYTQEVADDVGDKSVFWFLSLSEDEQAKVLSGESEMMQQSFDE